MGYIIFILISLIFSIVESPIKMLHGNGITFIKIFFCVFSRLWNCLYIRLSKNKRFLFYLQTLNVSSGFQFKGDRV